MRIAFGPALPVGTAGEREYFDVLLTRYVPAPEALRALVSASVEELAAVACGYVDVREPSLAASLTIAEYEVIVKGGTPPEEFERTLSETIATGSLLVMHKGKEKVFDLTEALPKRPEVTVRDGWPIVRVWVRMSDRGSLRPEALVRAADPGAVVSVTRLDLLIEEGGEWRRPLERGTPWQT
jgi:radical SAM-linked protein